MSFILESPLPALFLGLVAVIVGLLGLMQTGARSFVALIGGGLALALGLLLLEHFVKTDREQVQHVFYDVATALKTNHFPDVAHYIAPEATEMASVAQSQLSLVEVTDAAVTSGIDVKLTEEQGAKKAEATFVGRIVISNAKGDLIEFSKQPYVRKFTVSLRKEGKAWLMTDYQDQSLIGGN